MALCGGERIFRIRLAVCTQYQRVTDEGTDGTAVSMSRVVSECGHAVETPVNNKRTFKILKFTLWQYKTISCFRDHCLYVEEVGQDGVYRNAFS